MRKFKDRFKLIINDIEEPNAQAFGFGSAVDDIVTEVQVIACDFNTPPEEDELVHEVTGYGTLTNIKMIDGTIILNIEMCEESFLSYDEDNIFVKEEVSDDPYFKKFYRKED